MVGYRRQRWYSLGMGLFSRNIMLTATPARESRSFTKHFPSSSKSDACVLETLASGKITPQSTDRPSVTGERKEIRVRVKASGPETAMRSTSPGARVMMS